MCDYGPRYHEETIDELRQYSQGATTYSTGAEHIHLDRWVRRDRLLWIVRILGLGAQQIMNVFDRPEREFPVPGNE